jgi:hypothetical protein
MTLQIKPQFTPLYSSIKDLRFTFLSASFTAPTGGLSHSGWVVLAAGNDGELYSFKREHVKIITPLEVVLE